MYFKQQDRFNYVEGKMLDLKPQYMQCMMSWLRDDKMEGILLIDAKNALNSINQKVMLRNLKFKCPVIATYISNCYMCPARLFIIGGGELLSNKVIQHQWVLILSGYHHCFNFWSISFPLTNWMPKRLVFADDFAVASKLSSIKD